MTDISDKHFTRVYGFHRRTQSASSDSTKVNDGLLWTVKLSWKITQEVNQNLIRKKYFVRKILKQEKKHLGIFRRGDLVKIHRCFCFYFWIPNWVKKGKSYSFFY